LEVQCPVVMRKQVFQKNKDELLQSYTFTSFFFFYLYYFRKSFHFLIGFIMGSDLDEATNQSCSFERGIGICVALLNTCALRIMNWYPH